MDNMETHIDRTAKIKNRNVKRNRREKDFFGENYNVVEKKDNVYIKENRKHHFLTRWDDENGLKK
jgi:hypothetical protein